MQHQPRRTVNVLVRGLLALTLAISTQLVAADDSTVRPTRLIVPNAPGGGTDIIARHVAQYFSETLHMPAMVENRVGGGSLAGTDYVAKANADGYTLLLGGVSSLAINPALCRNLPYDPLRDFVAVGYLSAYPFVLVARPDFPGDRLADLVREARARPGALSYASAGVGTVQHVWGAILVKALGLNMVHVPYKGSAPAVQDMLALRVDIFFDNLSAQRSYLESGRLKALAVSSATRSPKLPQVPTVEETGLVRFHGESWFGLFAPAQTPAPTIERLRNAIGSLTRSAQFSATIERDGGRAMPIPNTEQQNFLQGEIERWAQQIAQFGVVAD